MSIRKQIKENVFDIYQEFITNIPKETTKPEIAKKQTIITLPNNNSTNDITIKPELYRFDIQLKKFLPRLKKFKHTSRAAKHHKPVFLKNNKKNKKYLTNPNIIFYNENKIIISKKFLKKATDYDVIVIDKSRLNIEELNLK
jgi:hypothetical protein